MQPAPRPVPPPTRTRTRVRTRTRTFVLLGFSTVSHSAPHTWTYHV